MYERNNYPVPSYIIHDLRMRRGLEDDDTIQDADILSMSGYEMLDEWLNWNGICGYTTSILEAIQYAYGIDLQYAPFDEDITRKLADD